MRDFLVLFVVYASLPGVLISPFYGLAVYSWLAYMRPHDLAWSLGDTRLSLYVAILLFLGLSIAILRGREKLMLIRAETILLVGLISWVTLSCEVAVAEAQTWFYWEMLANSVVIALITTGIVNSYQRLKNLVLVISMSLGLLGLKYALFGLMRGGVRIVGGPGGFMTDNNGFAAAMVVAVALLGGVAMSDDRRWVKTSASILLVACLISVIFTFSRGGLLGLGVVGSLLLLRSRRPVLSAAALLIAVSGFALITSDTFQEAYLARAETISTYEEDSSAMGRIVSWKTAVEVARDRPLTGVGLGNFPLVYSQYSTAKARVAHNAFFQLLAETGYPGAFLWLSIVVSSMLRLESISRDPRRRYLMPYARTFQIAIVGYFVGAMFLDLALFDLFYHVVALGVCLDVVPVPMEAGQPEPLKERSETRQWWRDAPASAQ